MSSFDPSTFLDATTTDALTRRPPIPAGKELVGILGEPKFRQSQGKQDPTKVYSFLDIPVEIDLNQDQEVRQLLGIDKVTVTYGFGLDLTESGGLDTSAGKNGRLRVLRDATGTNVAGEQFSLRKLQGRQVKVKIKHEAYEGEMYDKIDSVVKA